VVYEWTGEAPARSSPAGGPAASGSARFSAKKPSGRGGHEGHEGH
jgi:hypothetical protein